MAGIGRQGGDTSPSKPIPGASGSHGVKLQGRMR